MTPFTLLNTSCFCKCQKSFFCTRKKNVKTSFFLSLLRVEKLNSCTKKIIIKQPVQDLLFPPHPKIHFCSFSLNNSDFCQVDEGWPIHRHTFQTYDFASNPWRCRQLHLFGRQWPGKKRAKFCGTTPSWRTLWTFRDLTEQRRGEGTRWCRDWLSSGR